MCVYLDSTTSGPAITAQAHPQPLYNLCILGPPSRAIGHPYVRSSLQLRSTKTFMTESTVWVWVFDQSTPSLIQNIQQSNWPPDSGFELDNGLKLVKKITRSHGAVCEELYPVCYPDQGSKVLALHPDPLGHRFTRPPLSYTPHWPRSVALVCSNIPYPPARLPLKHACLSWSVS